MPKDPFKTRLEIAKSKISKKNLYNKKDNPSSIGNCLQIEHRISICCGCRDNYWVYF
jgi:hypothetical protein